MINFTKWNFKSIERLWFTVVLLHTSTASKFHWTLDSNFGRFLFFKCNWLQEKTHTPTNSWMLMSMLITEFKNRKNKRVWRIFYASYTHTTHIPQNIALFPLIWQTNFLIEWQRHTHTHKQILLPVNSTIRI